MSLFRRGRAVALCTALCLVAAAAPALGGAAAAAPAETAPIDPVVRQRTELPGTTTFFVRLKSGAHLDASQGATDRTDRVRRVYEAKKAHAEQSQAGLRAVLTARKAPFTPYWITNAIKVTGDKQLLFELARHPDVAQILPDRTYRLTKPVRQEGAPGTQAVEWNIDRVRAPEVWQTYGTRGEGIVVGTIDTGAQFDHPAIARQYRGARSGAPDHSYNWYDPSLVCGNPSSAPCDNVGHGTHVLGTIVGDDGGENKIGVAPGAQWIAAKGCETDTCSTSALLSAGEWMVAPRDANGANPRPDLAPDVINNSWGGGPGDPFYRDMVDTWVAAGIFPVFSAGNDGGSGCSTVGSPGDYAAAYAVGASTRADGIAWYSSRGPSVIDGGTKPDITAPGDEVRSSLPGGQYGLNSGTSMAAPHVTGAVALMWSASAQVRNQVPLSRELLDGTAVPVDDRSCGGTGADNNVWGHGRLDAYEAVTRAPRGPVGAATGTVRAGGHPVADALVRFDNGLVRSTRTAADGTYTLPSLAVGEHTATASTFGYLTASRRVTITEGTTTAVDFELAAAPRHTVSGQVRGADGAPVPGATVTAAGTPLPPVTTDADGRYRLPDVPVGRYDLTAEGDRCRLPQREQVEVDGDEQVDFALPARTDGIGHVCAVGAPAPWTDADTALPLEGDDVSVPVDLPFPVNLYDQSYRRVHVSTNGFLSFTTALPFFVNGRLPNPSEPNTAVYAFWDDLYVDGAASVRTRTTGTAGQREFVVEWRNVGILGEPPEVRVDFEVVLHENGPISLRYRGIGDNPREAGSSATVGVEDETGTDALEYANELPVLSDNKEITFRVPDTGLVRGRVVDATDQGPVADAEVTATQPDRPDRVARTDRDGYYQLRARTGDAHLKVASPHYDVAETDVDLRADRPAERDFALRTAALRVSTTSLDFVVPRDQSRTRTITLSNPGSAEARWEAEEGGGGAVRQATAVQRAADVDTSARTSRGLPSATPADARTAAPGQVIRQWPTTGLQLGWGVGVQDGPWISDGMANANRRFTTTGDPGTTWPTPWTGGWPADSAYVAARGLMCQVAVGGDNGIHCWDPATGQVTERITGSLPWTATSQRGLAYRPDDDTFYVGGWNEGVIYHVKGLSHPDRGAVVGRCSPADPGISGLAWNSSHGLLWAATNTPTDTVYGLNPDTCETLRTIAPPDSAPFSGAGLETDPAGNLWMVSQGGPSTAYLVDSGLPDFTDVPWLRAEPASGRLAVGATQDVQVRVDTTGLAPGVYGALLFFTSNSAREPVRAVQVRLVVPGYQAGVNAGGTARVDALGDTWQADRAYTAGGFGYLDNRRSRVLRTAMPISGTDEQQLYRDQRENAYEYRFDNVPNGWYAIDLEFAELRRTRPDTRVFDVLAEDRVVLPAVDVALAAGSFTALHRTVYAEVTDGQLNLRLARRVGDPIVNAIRVTHRPDHVG
ncbi:S8 family serine peptidase [Saccharothrix syringae]|uniref:Peptidase n=1 Tax=Saccharothrix syringae TaxID=103733 RepID=A0A5Q0H1A2_SACSY|nr:S8 family serine peptidase [Saccharothrix syringae]QFZ19685.1 hypothetical protein EKG83_21640 [Saccharothrix syringae]